MQLSTHGTETSFLGGYYYLKEFPVQSNVAAGMLHSENLPSMVPYLRWGFDQADRLDPLRECPPSVLDETIDDSTEVEPTAPRKPR